MTNSPPSIPLHDLLRIIANIHRSITLASDIPYRERVAACKALHTLKEELESIYARDTNPTTEINSSLLQRNPSL